MNEVVLSRHPDSIHMQRVHVAGEHIANIEHRLRPVMGAGQSTFQSVWTIHGPDHAPRHFDPITVTSLEKAKNASLMLSIHGDIRNIKTR